MPFVILMRRRHLDNTTFFVFPKRVILKREDNIYIASTFSRAQNTKLSYDAPVCMESDCMFVRGTASLNFRIWLILTLGFLTTLQNSGFSGDGDEVWTESPSSWPSSWEIRHFIKCYL